LIEIATGDHDVARDLATHTWINPLDDLGQRIAIGDASSSQNALIKLAKTCYESKNKILASDSIGAPLRGEKTVDFEGMVLKQGIFLSLDFTHTHIKNIEIRDSYAAEIMLPAKSVTNVILINSITPRVFGLSSMQALPSWIINLDAERYDSVASQSRIRNIGLSPNHEMLVTFIRKTFFQKGAGRKEEALMRGFGQLASRTLAIRILNVMKRDGLISSFKGDEGPVYVPNRSHTARMQNILDELSSSKDELWHEIGQL
jgi:hypothetical protein